MVDIIHRVGIKAPPNKVYTAVATVEGVAGWWTKDATGVSELGRTSPFVFQSPKGEEIGKFESEVLELIPDNQVRWRVPAGRLHRRDVWSPELARGRGVHGSLQYEVGNFHAQPQGARRDRQGEALSR